MAMKKCPICRYATEDESVSICPICNADMEEVNEAAEAKEVQDSAVAADEEAAAGAEAEAVAEGEAVADEEVPEDFVFVPDDENEEGESEPSKSKKGFIAAIAVLAVLIVAGAIYIGLSFFGGASTPKTIDVKSFTKENVSGLYTSELQGRYFEFTIKDTEVQIPDENAASEAEEEVTSDAAVASDAKEENVITEIHDGVFVSAFTDEYISSQCAAEYIRMNNLTSDFEAYVKENNIADDDYGAYIKAKKLEDDVNAFDEEYDFTGYMQGNASNGTWKFENMTVKLFDSTGAEMYDLAVTPYGLVNTNTYFKGDMKSGKTVSTTLECVLNDITLNDGSKADITEYLTFYKDGNFIFKEIYSAEIEEESYSAGPYTIKDNTVTIELQGNKNKFLILDDGICMGAFSK